LNVPKVVKKTRNTTLFDFWDADEGNSYAEGWKNKLIWGDNRFVMSSLLPKFSGKINLIYIDPPFATGADFKFKIKVGEEKKKLTKEHSVLEEKAYRDTWGSGLDTYLRYMHERIILMKELLADDGSIYVHLDWHIGHYVKLIMDELFGIDNFRNEIVWAYPAASAQTKSFFVRSYDMILFYSKSDNYTFNDNPEIYMEYSDRVKKNLQKDEKGTFYYRGGSHDGKKLARKVYISKPGVFPRDVWNDIPYVRWNTLQYQAFATQKPEALLKRIILASTNKDDIIADFFCGSGTTLATAEKLNRRWIGCDLSRYAIHLVRKRILEIEKSKDLYDKKKLYSKNPHPFEILNLGKYERQYWQITTFNNKDKKQLLFEYLAFMLKLYEAEPVSGFNYIHGKKGNALVFIGSVDSPITIQEVLNAINECKSLGQKELHVLGWEWEMGLNYAIQEISKKEGIKLKLRIIPNNVLEKQAVERGDIQFFELAYFRIDIKKKEKKLLIELEDFVIPHTDLIPEQIKSKIKNWTDWIDYWAIDFDFRNNQFNNNWTSYRTRKDRNLRLKAEHTYQTLGTYKIFIKIIDIFGVDTSQIYEVEIK
jgi:DNA modification methylase